MRTDPYATVTDHSALVVEDEQGEERVAMLRGMPLSGLTDAMLKTFHEFGENRAARRLAAKRMGLFSRRHPRNHWANRP